MACHYPKPAYLSTEGKVTFVRHEKALGHNSFIHVRCGMCRGCKADHARDWAIRSYHESQRHKDSCFITLTYSEEFLPPHGTLSKKDLQVFFHKLRKAVAPVKIRYFACGEYGTRKGRPHYHAVLFGFRPEQKVLVELSEKGNPQYQSEIFSKVWHYGRHTWTNFDQKCARYVAHYTADKLKSFAYDAIDPDTGLRPYEVIDRDGVIWQLTPEFQLQSLKPAIGLEWFRKNYKEVFPADSVVMDGKEYPPPRFYYQTLQKLDPALYEVVQANRKKKSKEVIYESGLRMWQKAQSKEAKLSRLKRPTHDRSMTQ